MTDWQKDENVTASARIVKGMTKPKCRSTSIQIGSGYYHDGRGNPDSQSGLLRLGSPLCGCLSLPLQIASLIDENPKAEPVCSNDIVSAVFI
jgi:hypothetical protein